MSHYPEEPGFKEGATSREAAEAIKARAEILRNRCYEFIHFNPGHTADEVAEVLEESVLAVRPRISELRTTNQIVNYGRGINKSGASAHRWVTLRYLGGLDYQIPEPIRHGAAAGLIAANGDCNMSGLFGFSTEPATGGDFLPIIKYDARAGRILRVDRVDQGGGNFVRQETDITDRFLAMADLENVEVGWINFPQGGAPHAVLVPFNPTNLKLPPQPSDQHKNGIRFLVKLHASCADGTPEVREVMTTAKAALNGIEALVQEFLTERNAGRHLDELPIIKLGSVTPIKTGSGSKTSTNYTPKFVAVGWNKRPSTFVFSPKDGPRPVPAGQAQAQTNGGQQAPATGATRAAPPQQMVSQPQQPPITGGVDVNDFG